MNLLSKFSKGFLAVVMFGALSASAFTEGEDYVKLQKPLPVEQNTLVKVFSYACPFCYKYDKTVTPKVVEKVAGLKYVPFHLKTKGEYGEAASKIFAVLAVMDEEKGVSKERRDKILTQPKTTKKQGSGIGLYFGKKLANEKLSGDVKLLSAGNPTTFELGFEINLKE